MYYIYILYIYIHIVNLTLEFWGFPDPKQSPAMLFSFTNAEPCDSTAHPPL